MAAMPSRLVFLDGAYPQAVQAVYAARPGLADEPWAVQNRAILDYGFGVADAWSAAVEHHGTPALDIIVGVPALDRALAADGYAWAEDAVVVLRHPSIDPVQWAAIQTKARACLILVSSEAPTDAFLAQFELVVTAFPHYAESMAQRGLHVRYLPLAFDPRRIGLDVAGTGYQIPFYAA